MIVGNGRPLRFLALVGGGWVSVRILLLWQETGSLPEAVRAIARPAAVVIADATATPIASPTAFRVPAAASMVLEPRTAGSVASAVGRATPVDPTRAQLALLAMTRIDGSVSADPSPPSGAPVLAGEIVTMPPPVSRQASRWAVSGWMIARGGTGAGVGARAPQLGGTQGGVRVDYALGSGIAATGRLAAPAAGAGREVSFGVAWRPARLPLRIVAEQRIAIDGGRSGPALGVSMGVSTVRLPARFDLEGYGQAGAIARDGIEKYVDASVRAARPLGNLGGMALNIGGGAWGGAQRGVARVDIGPSIGAHVPLAGKTLRVALDWRQRIAGNARPGSGPALTLGTDF